MDKKEIEKLIDDKLNNYNHSYRISSIDKKGRRHKPYIIEAGSYRHAAKKHFKTDDVYAYIETPELIKQGGFVSISFISFVVDYTTKVWTDNKSR